MNIAMLVYSHFSRDARVRRYAESLARKGYQVDIICLKENYHPKEQNINLIMYPVPRRRFGKFWYPIEYLLFMIYSAITVTSNYLIKKYPFIHIHNMPDILVFTAVIPKIFGAKIILDMHDPMPELYMSKYHTDENCLIVKWLKWLERKSLEFADKIITANDVFRELFLKRDNISQDKISVILNCPDPKIFKFKNGKSHKTNFNLLYMGTVDERFGLDIVIDAMPKLIKIIPNIIFTIIPKLEDEGEYFQNLKEKIIASNLSNYVKLESPLPLENIVRKMQTTDIGLVLARNGAFTDLIFPVKLLEFIQMGIPVIATKTKILGKYFTDQQICFLSQNTPEEFASNVLKLYRSNKLRTDIAKRACKYLEVNNWPKEERKYFGIIETLSNNRSFPA